jgi:hypothetical protein
MEGIATEPVGCFGNDSLKSATSLDQRADAWVLRMLWVGFISGVLRGNPTQLWLYCFASSQKRVEKVDVVHHCPESRPRVFMNTLLWYEIAQSLKATAKQLQ